MALPFVFSACPGDDSGSADGDSAADTAGAATDVASDGADSTGDGSPFDEAEVIEQASMYATNLEKINVDSFASAHGLADTVNVYINSEAADLYRSIDTEAVVDVGFPEGTLIVKEHLNGEGAEDGFLMMYRGPEGYLPDAGGWFWARIDGTGATRETGAVGFCISCHMPVDGWVFGVPADNQG
ncbi:MAG: cytochrome P460 family protein [Myxococcota bacterium]